MYQLDHNSGYVITIDGPAGAGKTTAAIELSKRLGLPRVSGGLFYRAIAWLIDRLDLDAHSQLDCERAVTGLSLKFSDRGVAVNGLLAKTAELMSDPEVTSIVPIVASYPAVRQTADRLLRKIGETGAIAEGRDNGVTVFRTPSLRSG